MMLVLRRSILYEIASEDKEILFPNDTFVLGDSIYPTLPWLIPPFRDNGHLTSQQTEFIILCILRGWQLKEHLAC